MNTLKRMQGSRLQSLSSSHIRLKGTPEKLCGNKVQLGVRYVPAGYKAGDRDTLLPTQVLKHSCLVPQICQGLFGSCIVFHLGTFRAFIKGNPQLRVQLDAQS